MCVCVCVRLSVYVHSYHYYTCMYASPHSFTCDMLGATTSTEAVCVTQADALGSDLYFGAEILSVGGSIVTGSDYLSYPQVCICLCMCVCKRERECVCECAYIYVLCECECECVPVCVCIV